MATISPAASSTFSRAKVAIFLLVTAAVTYTIYQNLPANVERDPPSGSNLHRSNAVHRRRRRPTAYRPRAGEVTGDATGDSTEDASFFVEDSEDDPGTARRTTAALHQSNNVDSSAAEPSLFVEDTDEDEHAAATVEEPGPARRGSLLDRIVDTTSEDEYDSAPWAPPRNGQNMVSLLFSISEDATRRNSYVHRGTLCNGCGAVPIRGIRYRCANCADYDLCETCEAQGQHYRTHVFYKIKVPITNYAPRHLQTPFYPGNPDHVLRQLPRDLVSRLTTETTLDRPEIDAYWEQWTCIANTEIRDDPDGLHVFMDRRTFDRYLIPSYANRYAAPNLIHDRMFAFYDQDEDGLISFPEYLQGLAYRKSKNKLKRIFQGYDINGDGYVDRKDFLRIFRSYYVLYKNMRKDMLESMDESAVSGVDAHALIHGRQPLSSAFGRDGQFGNAHSRPQRAGKRMSSEDGDLVVTDRLGVVLQDSEDHAERDDVFRNLLGRREPQPLNLYLSLLDMPARDLRHLRSRLTEALSLEANNGNAQTAADSAEGHNLDANHNDEDAPDAEDSAMAAAVRAVNEETRSASQKEEGRVNDILHERWRRRQFYTDEEEGAEPPSDWEDEEDIPRGVVENDEEPSRPAMSPRSRSSSKVRFAEDMDDYDTRSNPSTSSRSVAERWGGMEIADAERDVGKDVLYQVTQQAFNELLDNLFKNIEDEAINALTSSQTREKNRHLFTNPYFVKWAEAVEKLDKKPKDAELPGDEAADLARQMGQDMQREIAAQAASLQTAPVDLEETRQMDISDLLATSGYSVDMGAHDLLTEEADRLMHIMVTPTPEPTTSFPMPVDTPAPAPASTPAPQRGGIPRSNRRGSETPSENLRRDMLDAFRAADPFVHIREDVENPAPAAAEEPHIRELGPLNTDASDVTDALAEYRDPTLPQFRPNSVLPAAPSPPSAIRPGYEAPGMTAQERQDDLPPPRRRSRKVVNGAGGKKAAAKHRKLKEKERRDEASAQAETPLLGLRNELLAAMAADASVPFATRRALESWNWKALAELRGLEGVERRARERGGWARIAFGEFEDVVRGRDGDGNGNGKGGRAGGRKGEREVAVERLVEYLGSWIELCIQ